MVDIFAHPYEFSQAQHLPSILENLEIPNEEQRRSERKLLKEFQNLFSSCDADVGRFKMTQHRKRKRKKFISLRVLKKSQIKQPYKYYSKGKNKLFHIH
ncbi:hypothetical protein AVEN_147933-1 [Araneus ventricosus]|uniref:Uncharacterized protein n=1 Tax=Araneus ventricosus TaxID=182803 RepID=A0A4Y2KAN7_ARAVE|nr:hypothetical protein AVEN_147933-1 [Araneus ventricosus]